MAISGHKTKQAQGGGRKSVSRLKKARFARGHALWLGAASISCDRRPLDRLPTGRTFSRVLIVFPCRLRAWSLVKKRAIWADGLRLGGSQRFDPPYALYSPGYIFKCFSGSSNGRRARPWQRINSRFLVTLFRGTDRTTERGLRLLFHRS